MRELYLDENGYYHIRPEYSELFRAWELLYNLHVRPAIQQLEEGIQSAKDALECDKNPENETCQQLDQQLEESKRKIWNSAIVVLYATGMVANLSATYAVTKIPSGLICGTRARLNTILRQIIAYTVEAGIQVEVTPGTTYLIQLNDPVLDIDIDVRNTGDEDSVQLYYRTTKEIGIVLLNEANYSIVSTKEVPPHMRISATTGRLTPIVEIRNQTINLLPHEGIALAPVDNIEVRVSATNTITIIGDDYYEDTTNKILSIKKGQVIILLNKYDHTTTITIEKL